MPLSRASSFYPPPQSPSSNSLPRVQNSRLSNHPDFVGIILILLESPKSRPICDEDWKNPNFWLMLWYFFQILIKEDEMQNTNNWTEKNWRNCKSYNQITEEFWQKLLC